MDTFTEAKAAYEAGTKAGLASGKVKVHVTFQDQDQESNIGGETLWATPTPTTNGMRYLIDNVPFFTTIPNFGDLVSAHPQGTGPLEFDAVVERGPWHWFVAGASPTSDAPTILSSLRLVEPSNDRMKLESGFDGLVAGVYLPEAAEAIIAKLRLLSTEKVVGFLFLGDEPADG